MVQQDEVVIACDGKMMLTSNLFEPGSEITSYAAHPELSSNFFLSGDSSKAEFFSDVSGMSFL
jgi:hypothetical protein